MSKLWTLISGFLLLIVTYTAHNIRFLRKKNGLKQAEIASCLGFVRNTWSNWENGVSEPDLAKLQSIAAYFKVDITDIISADMSVGVEKTNRMLTYPENELANQLVQESQGNYNINSPADIIAQQAVTIQALQSALIAAQREIEELKKKNSPKE